jgi:SSS family solute:Na+ symporter
MTEPTDDEKLKSFYRRIHPGGWWEPIRLATGMKKSDQQMGKLVVCWLSAVAMTYSILFLTGSLIFHEWINALIYAGIALASWLLLRVFITRTKIFCRLICQLCFDSCAIRNAELSKCFLKSRNGN